LSSNSGLGEWLMGRICNSKIPAVMLMGKSPLKYRS
jgi:hypothetical protein